ncbi:hypothetical protein [Streptomyces sp. MNP-20]|uniref:hypothetical protein n=1 Tax=Streptomyces sp. MNP-20 TaxID=2721165 RepID=UPI0015552244|nr:hypothetical protein [Streptomyces sp. MNP-20]
MTTLRSGRVLKGATVTALAVFVCHVILSTGFAAARAEQQAAAGSGGDSWAGTGTWLITFVLGTALVMPLMLWTGMRILREKGCRLLVIGGGVAWFFGAGHGVDGIDSVQGGLLPVPLLVGVVALGTLLSAPTSPTPRTDPTREPPPGTTV